MRVIKEYCVSDETTKLAIAQRVKECVKLSGAPAPDWAHTFLSIEHRGLDFVVTLEEQKEPEHGTIEQR